VMSRLSAAFAAKVAAKKTRIAKQDRKDIA
jgi:hypothetical protein